MRESSTVVRPLDTAYHSALRLITSTSYKLNTAPCVPKGAMICPEHEKTSTLRHVSIQSSPSELTVKFNIAIKLE